MEIPPFQQQSDELTAFRVKFIRYGTLAQPARWSTVEIIARTSKEAIKTAKSRYRRAAKFCLVK